MSDYTNYYEACKAGVFFRRVGKECGCRGAGWMVSDLDTVHQCPYHYMGQPHPEDDDDGALDAWLDTRSMLAFEPMPEPEMSGSF